MADENFDKNLLRAEAFLRRSEEASSLCRKMLCLYDGFVCLYGPADACKIAAAGASVDFSELEKALDSCMDDADRDAAGSDISDSGAAYSDAFDSETSKTGSNEVYVKPTSNMADALTRALKAALESLRKSQCEKQYKVEL